MDQQPALVRLIFWKRLVKTIQLFGETLLCGLRSLHVTVWTVGLASVDSPQCGLCLYTVGWAEGHSELSPLESIEKVTTEPKKFFSFLVFLVFTLLIKKCCGSCDQGGEAWSTISPFSPMQLVELQGRQSHGLWEGSSCVKDLILPMLKV